MHRAAGLQQLAGRAVTLNAFFDSIGQNRKLVGCPIEARTVFSSGQQLVGFGVGSGLCGVSKARPLAPHLGHRAYFASGLIAVIGTPDAKD
jgi:hypothetical protein